MNTVTIIRPRTKAEFDAYYALRWEVLRKPHLKEQGSERDERDASAQHVMAVDGRGHTVGVGRIHLREDGVAQVRYMAVHPSNTQRGIGRQILESLESMIYDAQGPCEIELNARNTAVPFYEKCGYQQVRSGNLLWGMIPHTVMQKFITCRE